MGSSFKVVFALIDMQGILFFYGSEMAANAGGVISCDIPGDLVLCMVCMALAVDDFSEILARGVRLVALLSKNGRIEYKCIDARTSWIIATNSISRLEYWPARMTSVVLRCNG